MSSESRLKRTLEALLNIWGSPAGIRLVAHDLELLDAKIERVEREFSGCVERLSGRFDRLTNRGPDDPMSHLQSVRNANNVVVGRIERLEASLVTAERVEQLEESLNATAEGLAKEIDAVRQRLSLPSEELQTLQGCIDRLETIIKRLFGSNLDDLAYKAKVSNVFQRLEELEGRVIQFSQPVYLSEGMLRDSLSLKWLEELEESLGETAEGLAKELSSFEKRIALLEAKLSSDEALQNAQGPAAEADRPPQV